MFQHHKYFLSACFGKKKTNKNNKKKNKREQSNQNKQDTGIWKGAVGDEGVAGPSSEQLGLAVVHCTLLPTHLFELLFLFRFLFFTQPSLHQCLAWSVIDRFLFPTMSQISKVFPFNFMHTLTCPSWSSEWSQAQIIICEHRQPATASAILCSFCAQLPHSAWCLKCKISAKHTQFLQPGPMMVFNCTELGSS